MGNDQPRQRTGLLGGSFDPIHSGHLIIAYDAMEALGLDEVFFIPAAQSPLKPNTPGATKEQRRKMVEIAVADEPAFQVLDYELQQSNQKSYTIDTLRYLHEHYANREFFWILGTDQFEKLPRWKDIEKLSDLMEFAVLARKGTPLIPPKIQNLDFNIVNGHPIAISSSEIRERCQKKLAIKHFLPSEVAQYISQHHLYNH